VSKKAKDIKLEAIGNWLKEKRKAAGYNSHVSFAADNDLDQKYYFQVEKGRHNIGFLYLMRMAEIHNVTLSQLFTELDL